MMITTMLEMKVRLFESCITKSAFSVHSFAQVEAAVLYEQKNLNSKESGNVKLSAAQFEAEPGVGLHDPCGSLLPLDIL